jgi:hemerythrin-like domain-containing protein
MKITDALLAEHVVFHTLFDHLEVAAPGLKTLAEVRALAGLLESMLLQHSKAEDELLMNYLDDSIEQMGHRDTFHEEHELIERHIGAIRSARDIKTARRLLVEAVVGARKHFDKEERLVFPLAEKVISYHNIMKLGDEWLAQKAR